jgi:hypothetical protein
MAMFLKTIIYIWKFYRKLMSKIYHKVFFCVVMLATSIVCAQNPPCPPGSGPCGGEVDDVLPLEHDLLMIVLAIALAIFYFKRSTLFGVKKSNS